VQRGIDRTLSGTELDRGSTFVQQNISGADQNHISDSSLDRQEFTLLHRTVLHQYGMSLRCYLDDVAKGLDTPDVNGRTPLLWAAWRGDLDTVALLLQAKADIDKQDH
jgi:ankyrin repeat protein